MGELEKMKITNDGRLTKLMRVAAWVIGIPCLYGSAKLSVAGVGLGGDLWWFGWVLAAAFTLSQFIVNGSYEKELNWTILALGVGSYVASIWMNVLGIYEYKVQEAGVVAVVNFWYVADNFDFGTILLGIFIDAFPEMSLRWAMGESRVGDWLGNIVKTYQNPEMLTKSLTIHSPTVQVTHNKNTGKNRREELRKMYHTPAEEDEDDDDMGIPVRANRYMGREGR